MDSKDAPNGSQKSSRGSLESFKALRSPEPNIEEREKFLSELTTDEGDADLSLAFTNVRDRLADKT